MSDTSKIPRDEWAAALGLSIKVRRTDLGMSRRQLASATAISYSYMSAIENGAKAPSTKILRILAERLGLQPQDLLTDIDRRLGGIHPSPDPAADDISEIVERQERRFLRRQQQRMGVIDRPGRPSQDTEELTRLAAALDDDDYAILVNVAEGLIARKLRPET